MQSMYVRPEWQQKTIFRKSLPHEKHIANIARFSERNMTCTFYSESELQVDFCKDICQMMVSANIQFKTSKIPQFKMFLRKYTKLQIPRESTIQKHILHSTYNDVVNYIRYAVANNKIWVSIYETTDIKNRYVANVIIDDM